MTVLNKILVIRLSSIGDITLTTPLVRHLATAYPDAQIDYCTKSPFVSLLVSNPRISTTYTTDHPPVGNYDLVVDLQNNFRSKAIVRSLNSVRTVRYRKENWKKWLLVHFKLDFYGFYRSVVERYGDSLPEICISPGDQQGCELYLSSEELSYAAPYFQIPQKTLALCFGAKHFTKRYPPKLFAALVSILLKNELLQIVLLGGIEDAPQATELMNSLPDTCRSRVVNLAGSCTLMQSAAILSRSDAVLCNDTGLMHIASSFGKKLFVLFGSSSQAFGFLPWNTPYELFEIEGLHCKPCSHIGRDHCPKAHFRCMNDLLPGAIAEHIHSYLKLIP
ncbi:MAG: glycosyltransferase family 9 protein [Chlorobium sp.]|nr:MAG: glycosyltransferase family 9 protein [Chlorobium sp.]